MFCVSPRPLKGQGIEPPSRSAFPPAAPPIADLLGHVHAIRRVLTRCGVRPADRADLLQDVLLAAWLRITAEQFRPDPAAPPSVALRGWLNRIAYHKADHYREHAWLRLTELAGLGPREALPDQTFHPIARLEARDELAAIRHLRRADRAALLAFATGCTLEEVGVELCIPVGVAFLRVDLGRRILAQLTDREGAR